MGSPGDTSAVPTAETWPEYVRRISGGATQAQIADRIGVGRLSVCNWLHGKTRPKAETVISVARAYRRSPVEALIAASYLGSDETEHPVEIRVSLAVDGQGRKMSKSVGNVIAPQKVSDTLGAEVLRRLTLLD